MFTVSISVMSYLVSTSIKHCLLKLKF